MNKDLERAITRVTPKEQMSLQEMKRQLKNNSKSELVNIIVNLASVVDLYKDKIENIKDLIQELLNTKNIDIKTYNYIMDELNKEIKKP